MPNTPEPPPARTVPERLDHSGRTDRGVLARSSLTLLGRGISKFAVVAFLVVAARLLTKEEYGIYSYVLVLAFTFAILADPQVSIVAGRDVSSGRHTPATAYWSALPLVVASALVGAIALLAFGLVDSGPGSSGWALALAAAFVFFNRLFGLGLDMLRALGRFGTEAIIETTGTVLLVAVATAVAAAGLGVSAVLAVFCAHAIGSALVCHLVLRRDVGPPARVAGRARELLRTGVKLSVAAAATAVATRLPLIVLGGAASAAVVATFSAGLRFVDAAYLLALTAGQALLPSIASLASTDPGRAKRLARRAIALSLLGGGALAAVVAPFGSDIASAVFGSQYASSGGPTSVMILSVPFMGMFWISWFGLVAYHRERDVLAVAVASAAGTLFAAILLIPGGGAEAAAWVYAGAIAALALGTYAQFERRAGRTG